MLNWIKIAVAACLMVAGATMAGRAAQPFKEQAFAEAQAAGKAIVLHVTAPWCPTCRQQHPVVAAVEKERPELLVFDIDFDTSKDLLRRFGVRFQSTLIVFKGSAELVRSTGETDPAKLRALIARGL